MRLRDRVALVTGGGTGFGSAIAVRFASEGARVVASGRRSEQLEGTVAAIQKSGGEALAIAGDATVARDVEAMVRGATERFDALDILVNNAGVVFGRVTVEDCGEEEFRQTLEVNLMTVFLCSRAALPELRRRGGSIINIASMGGLKPQRRHVPYSVAKAAVVHLTKCMALDHADEGVRVNCICPAYIETDINREHLRRLRETGAFGAGPRTWRRRRPTWRRTRLIGTPAAACRSMAVSAPPSDPPARAKRTSAPATVRSQALVSDRPSAARSGFDASRAERGRPRLDFHVHAPTAGGSGDRVGRHLCQICD